MQNQGPIVPKKEGVERWLYEVLRRLELKSNQTQRGLSAVSRGETPDGSGTPLVDLSQYFYLPGRSGGQIGHGAIEADGTLTLVSTKSSDKGFIYLGADHGGTYDEGNTYLGLGTATPAVKLHINTPSAGTTTIGAVGTPFARATYASTTLFDLAPIYFGGSTYDVALKPYAAGFQIIASDGTAGMRLVPASGRAYIQAGYLNSGGVPQSPNMSLTGIGATYGANLGIAFDEVYFVNSTGSPEIGVNIDPNAVTPWKGLFASRGHNASTPGITVVPFSETTGAQALEMRKNVSTSFGVRYISMEYDATTGLHAGRVSWWYDETNRAGYITMRLSPFGGGSGKLVAHDRNGSRALGLDSGTLWNDSVTTTLIDLGDTISALRSAAVGSIDGAVFDRFAVMSEASLFTDVLVGGAVAPPGALLDLRNTVGSLPSFRVLLNSDSTRVFQVDASGTVTVGDEGHTDNIVRFQIRVPTEQTSSNIMQVIKEVTAGNNFTALSIASTGALTVGDSSTTGQAIERLTIRQGAGQSANLWSILSSGGTDALARTDSTGQTIFGHNGGTDQDAVIKAIVRGNSTQSVDLFQAQSETVARGAFSSAGLPKLYDVDASHSTLFDRAADGTSHTLTWPNAAPTVNNQVMIGQTSGAMSWATFSSTFLPIAETDITDGSILARVAANETITGLYTHTSKLTVDMSGGTDVLLDLIEADSFSGANPIQVYDASAASYVFYVENSGRVVGTGLRLLYSPTLWVDIQAPSLTALRTLTIPDVTGTVILNAGTQTISGNKTLSGNNAISGSVNIKNTGLLIYDATNGTDTGLIFDTSIITNGTGVTWQPLNGLSGNVPVLGNDTPAVAVGALGKVDLLTQTADLTAVALTNAPPAGTYLVYYYLETTTAAGGAGSLALTFTATDDVGARTQTAAATHVLTGTSVRNSGTLVIYVASGDITYTIANTGGYSTSQYAIHIRVVALG